MLSCASSAGSSDPSGSPHTSPTTSPPRPSPLSAFPLPRKGLKPSQLSQMGGQVAHQLSQTEHSNQVSLSRGIAANHLHHLNQDQSNQISLSGGIAAAFSGLKGHSPRAAPPSLLAALPPLELAEQSNLLGQRQMQGQGHDRDAAQSREAFLAPVEYAGMQGEDAGGSSEPGSLTKKQLSSRLQVGGGKGRSMVPCPLHCTALPSTTPSLCLLCPPLPAPPHSQPFLLCWIRPPCCPCPSAQCAS